MKTVLCSILTIFTFMLLAFVPKGFAQQSTSSDRMVRVVYFLPNDRRPQPDINIKLDTLIKDVQQFYANEMERHGFGRKTFRIETDRNGKALVHHVRGRFNDTHYQKHTDRRVYEETKERFDRSKNIYLFAIDVSTEVLGFDDVGGELCGQGSGGTGGGHGILPASGHCFNVPLTAHELGHAFGLQHDFHNDAYVMSYGRYRNELSLCHAEWLNAHLYFNSHQTPTDNTETAIKMTSSGASPPNAIRLRFEITDPDGLHQAQLLTPATGEYEGLGFPKLLDCKSLSGESNIIEFVTSELAEGPATEVALHVIDRHGYLRWERVEINIASLLPQGKVVLIPDTNLAAAIRETLGLRPRSAITQRDMLRLTRLEAPKRQITDLTGLEHATHLKYLDLWDNQIRNITPLMGLTRLKSINLWNNQISGIPSLVGLTDLTDLDLSSNSINDITPFVELMQLKGLSLGGNGITDITPLAGLTRLQNLWLWSNRISDITVLARLTKLRSLYLDGNPISDITPLTELTDLEHLGLAGLQITDIRLLSKFMQLKSLYLHGNPISDITPVAELTELEHLGLAGLQISDVTRFSELTKLRSLYLDRNQISDITSLAALTKLEQLVLVGNQISDIRPLEGLTKLKRLGLARNPILNISPLRTLLNRNPKLKLDIDTTQSAAVVQVGASERPGMYWINTQKGTLHRLISGKVERFVRSAQNATSLAVDVAGEKLYWTEKTGERSGRIRRANLKGSPNVKLIKEFTSVPLNIAFDAAAATLYLTNTRGKIQRLNVDGSDFQPNLIAGLEVPKEIALDVVNSKVYWTEMAGSIRRANLDGSNVETLATGLATPTSIAIADGNLYWTTQVNESTGKILRANLKGSNIRRLATVLGSPEDIVVDTTGRRLYWANTLGGIQRADLSGKNIQNLVTRLSTPTHLALGSALATTGKSVTAPIAKITGPWLWMIAPTEPNRGGKNSTNVDSIKIASRGAVTEADIAVNGAKAGDSVGSYAWTPGKIAETGSNNVNDLINKIGLVAGGNPASTMDDVDIDDHSAYALITLRSARVQTGVTMRTGSDDSIKVWLNGKVVHRKRVDRGAVDFQDTFKVNLEKGDNLLLVKVSERAGHWSMFVGIDANVRIKQPLAAPTLSTLEIALPAETALLTNYPNPFNPETWIPYQLTKPAEVTITIYAVNGQIVRRLALGHQPAGMYQNRSRAAYWDGRNAFGEPVASGVYFYTLTAGEFTATRKMLILK